MKPGPNWSILALALLGLFLAAGCVRQETTSTGPEPQTGVSPVPPTVTEDSCPSRYDGTYQGIFTYNYKLPVQDAQGNVVDYRIETDGVRLSVTLACASVSEEGVLLEATHVIASHPDFGCQVAGCTPVSPMSAAYLPAEGTSPGQPSQMGMGLTLIFPNGYQLITNSQPGALHVSIDGQVLSNSLDPSIQGFTFSVIPPAGASPSFPSEVAAKNGLYVSDGFQSWTLSKTT